MSENPNPIKIDKAPTPDSLSSLPLDQMEVGDSFTTDQPFASTMEVVKIYATTNHKGFRTETVKDGVRVTRTA